MQKLFTPSRERGTTKQIVCVGARAVAVVVGTGVRGVVAAEIKKFRLRRKSLARNCPGQSFCLCPDKSKSPIRINTTQKKGPTEAGPTTAMALYSNSVADPPASVRIANTMGAAAAAGGGRYHDHGGCYHHARRYHSAAVVHSAIVTIATASAHRASMPTDTATTGDGNC